MSGAARFPFIVLAIGLLASVVATTASADFQSSRDWFNGKSEAERRNLQGLLILLGHYDATIDGDFGRRTYNAIVAYEAARGFDGDGVLIPVEELQLTADSLNVYGQYGFSNTLTVDPRSGIAVPLAARIFVTNEATPNGTRWASADGGFTLETVAVPDVSLDALYRSLRRGEVVYETQRSSFFVVSGREGGREYYTSFRRRDGGNLGFSLTWPAPLNPVGSVLAAFLFSTVQYPDAFAGPPPVAVATPLPGVATGGDTPPDGGIAAGLRIAAAAQIVVSACPNLSVDTAALDRALQVQGLTTGMVYNEGGAHNVAYQEVVRATAAEIAAAGLTVGQICATYLQRYGPDAVWPNPPGLVVPHG